MQQYEACSTDEHRPYDASLELQVHVTRVTRMGTQHRLKKTRCDQTTGNHYKQSPKSLFTCLVARVCQKDSVGIAKWAKCLSVCVRTHALYVDVCQYLYECYTPAPTQAPPSA